ncbi:MAG TPA: hypothetical protein PKN33_14305 [Phycisphaerae bacterium]|nr:hypothetical protein [Phycisphaerae bacterium]
MISKNLTPARRRLVEAMRRLAFGRIENLVVRDGEPILDATTRFRRERKLGVIGSPPHRPIPPTCSLKSEIRELFDEFAAIGDGIVDAIEIRHGLPFRLITTFTHKHEGGKA